MISKLLNRKPKITAPVLPAVPDGVVVWAVGDVHGCLALLQALVEAILADAAATAASRKIVVFLGDYVDRGPDSRGVLRFLSGLTRNTAVEWRFLKGNHEAALLDFIADPSTGPRWCEYGGDATLGSYGLKPPQMLHSSPAWAGVSADFAHRVSEDEREFLESLETRFEIGDYFFAHAGARPGVSLDRQSSKDLLWIRGSFIESGVPFEKIVVHGHTPVEQVYADHRRIGIDTKAYESGVLTALRLQAGDREVLQAIGAGAVEEGGREVQAGQMDALGQKPTILRGPAGQAFASAGS